MKTVVATAVLLMAQLAHAAEPMGRIFFTPEERARLDALRSQRAVAVQTRDEPVPEIVKFNGIVRRADGRATVWINNQPLSEAELRNKQAIVGRVSRSGQVTLQSPQGAMQMQLKVGQSAELLSGRVEESYATAPANRESSVTAKPEPALGAPAASAPSTQSGTPVTPVDRKNAGEAGPKAATR